MKRAQLDQKQLRQIYEQAALWMLRHEEGALSNLELRRYEAWLMLPHRAEALHRMHRFSDQLRQPWIRRRLAMRLDAREEVSCDTPGLILDSAR